MEPIRNSTELEAAIRAAIADGSLTWETRTQVAEALWARVSRDWFASRPVDAACIASTDLYYALRDADESRTRAARLAARPAAAPSAETCARCGDARDLFCPMSDDGEGPHDIVVITPIRADDAAFLDRVAVHHEQGGQERCHERGSSAGAGHPARSTPAPS